MDKQLGPKEVISLADLINDCFKSFDLDGSGTISMPELKRVFHALDPHNWPDEKVELLLQAFDRNHDGEISFNEFVTWTCSARRYKSQLDSVVHKQIVSIARIVLDSDTFLFKSFDLDHDRKISHGELTRVLEYLTPSTFTKSEASRLLNAFDGSDKNRDGTLSFPEFVSLVCRWNADPATRHLLENDLAAEVHRIIAEEAATAKAEQEELERQELARQELQAKRLKQVEEEEKQKLHKAFEQEEQRRELSSQTEEGKLTVERALDEVCDAEISIPEAESTAFAPAAGKAGPKAVAKRAAKKVSAAKTKPAAKAKAVAGVDHFPMISKEDLLANHLEQSARLAKFFMSPAAATERHNSSAESDAMDSVLLTEAEVRKVLQDHVPGITGMMDRNGETPVSQYIWMSYQNGLPVYNDNPAVQQHTIKSLRYIFKCATTGVQGGSQALKRLCEAYQACQAEQGRTIDDLYGKLTGRDATLKDQVLALLDSYKFVTLEAVVHKLNPDAAGMSDSSPTKQATHIFSAYLEAVGTELGMRGVSAAAIDRNRPKGVKKKPILDGFRAHFSVEEVADAVVADVNQHLVSAERVINQDLLAKWAAETAETSGGVYDAYGIYYDEDRADDYEGRPLVGNEYVPFLRRQTAMHILTMLFL